MFISERRKKTSLYFNHCMSWHLICIQISNVHLSTNIWCQCLMQSFHFMLYSMHFFLIVRLQSRERERDRLFLIYLNGAIWIARRCSVHWINGSLLFTLVTIYYVRLLNEYIKYWNTNLLLLFEFRAVFIAVSCTNILFQSSVDGDTDWLSLIQNWSFSSCLRFHCQFFVEFDMRERVFFTYFRRLLRKLLWTLKNFWISIKAAREFWF